MAEYITDTDHAGADFTLANGDVIAGVHTNVKKMTIPAGATVTVKRYNGSSYGSVEVQALEILIAATGVLSAVGSGYGGGGGGGGEPRGGGYGLGGLGYGGGTSGNRDRSRPTSGQGGGSYGGAVQQLSYDYTGNPGGYMASGAQGDTTTDTSVIKGSGGGGGGGGASTEVYSGGGGGAGCTGGGIIKLIANLITVKGSILSNDASAGNANPGVPGTPTSGGNGGNAESAGSSGGGDPYGAGGGRGAGGGILLQFLSRSAQITAQPKVYAPGTINNYGGLDATNGGTLKIFAPSISEGSPSTGRLYKVTTLFGAMAS